jgi:iron(III) transport system substrate-binding protein
MAMALGVGCGQPAEAPAGHEGGGAAGEPREITVYSGRNEKLIGPLLARFGEERGVQVQARYGETAEMAATLLEEGAGSPADVFLAQDAAALGAVAQAGLLRPLPAEVLGRVPARFADPSGRWVGLSGRARTVVYNTGKVSPDQLPQSLPEVADPKFRGRFGVAPTNGSFQAHMAVYRVVHSEAALQELLVGLVANEPKDYANNGAIVNAVIAGEVDFGLVNHYYLLRALAEQPDAPAKNFFLPQGEASSFVNVAGAGAVSDDPVALELIRFLLEEEAQRYFATETYEYPLVTGVTAAADLVPLEQVAQPAVDFGQVAAVLEPTLAQIQASGLVR